MTPHPISTAGKPGHAASHRDPALMSVTAVARERDAAIDLRDYDQREHGMRSQDPGTIEYTSDPRLVARGMKHLILVWLPLIAGICFLTINSNIPLWQLVCGGLCVGFASGGRRA